MFRYTTVEEEFNDADLGHYVSYGICVTEDDNSILTVSDMSTNRDLVDKLVGLCNEHQLDPIHLLDVIEDALP